MTSPRIVAPRATDAAIEAELLDRREQGRNLQAIPADFAWRRLRDAFRDRVIRRRVARVQGDQDIDVIKRRVRDVPRLEA